jgi:simple sugar transport system substrate-binding protein
MNRHNILRTLALLMALVMLVSACGKAPTPIPETQPPATQPPAATEAPTATEPPVAEPFVFGMLMVGPYNDHGWSQAIMRPTIR